MCIERRKPLLSQWSWQGVHFEKVKFNNLFLKSKNEDLCMGQGGLQPPHRSCLAPPSEGRQRKFMNLWEQNFDACDYGNPIEQYCTNRFTPIKDQIFRRMQYITVWCDTCDHFLKGFDLCSAFNCILSCVHALIHA